MKKKSYRELKFDELKCLLYSCVKCNRDTVDCKYEIECGRGSYIYLMKLFAEEVSRIKPINLISDNSINLSMGYVIKNIFIPGFGMLKITHNARFDKEKNKELSCEIVGSLPKSSYSFELFKWEEDKKISLLKSSIIVELPKPSLLQRFKNWLKLKLS